MSYATAAGFHESGLKSLPGNTIIFINVFINPVVVQ